MVFAAASGGSTKNGNKPYAGAYVEHKKTGSMSSHNHANHHQYTFKKPGHNWNGGGEASSKGNRLRHGSKGGGPMQLDPEPMFLQNDSKLDRMEQLNAGRSQTTESRSKEPSKPTMSTEDDQIVAVAQKFTTKELPDYAPTLDYHQQDPKGDCVSFVDGNQQTVSVMLQKGAAEPTPTPSDPGSEHRSSENRGQAHI